MFIFLGLGFFLNAYWLRHELDINYVRQMIELQIWGTFSIALGGGLVFAAFLTRRLVKRWGLNGDKVTVNAQHYP